MKQVRNNREPEIFRWICHMVTGSSLIALTGSSTETMFLLYTFMTKFVFQFWCVIKKKSFLRITIKNKSFVLKDLNWRRYKLRAKGSLSIDSVDVMTPWARLKWENWRSDSLWGYRKLNPALCLCARLTHTLPMWYFN